MVALEGSWVALGTSWGGLGPLLGALGPLLGDLGSFLGDLEAVLGRSWGLLAPSWAVLEGQEGQKGSGPGGLADQGREGLLSPSFKSVNKLVYVTCDMGSSPAESNPLHVA